MFVATGLPLRRYPSGSGKFMQILEFIKHLDVHLHNLIAAKPTMAYLLLFGVVFAETGLVVTPFLPGDTLLFAAGLLSNSKGGEPGFNLWIVLAVLTLAPICGDTVNYHIGKWLGPRLFSSNKNRFLKRENLDKTHEFFERHGGKAIILARWVPIVRTFAPFVAGMGAMDYKHFFRYSLAGAFIWVWVCTLAGYFFGGIPIVKQNFEIAMLAMLALTGGPMVFEAWRHSRKPKTPPVPVTEVPRSFPDSKE
jgi:membrane-associated protein